MNRPPLIEYRDEFSVQQREMRRYFMHCHTCGEVCKGHSRDEGFVPALPKTIKLSDLIEKKGSLIQLLGEYWHGNLERTEERIIESEVDLQTRLGYKPSDYR